MDTHQTKFKFGTADTVLLAVGTLAVDYVCTSESEIVEVMPGGKKLYFTIEELEEKIKRYGIKKGKHYPGSSIGNFLNQVQLLTKLDPTAKPAHLATAMALHVSSAQILLKSLDDVGIQYDITEFIGEHAANPIALLVESEKYTKILSYKDKRLPAIQVHDPKEGKPGLVMIGAAAGHAIESKRNAFNYALERNIPIGMITTEGEINELAKNAAFKEITREILQKASFFSCNDDEARKILLAENPDSKPSTDKVTLVQQLRDIFKNDKLDILLSFGAEGSLALVGDTVVMQKIPDTPRHSILSSAGAGDTLAGAFVQGVRIKGMDVEGVKWVLPRANRAAQNVLKYEDTRTGQFTAEEFLEEPPKAFETQIIPL